MLDELPSLEIAATAVALVLVLRTFLLSRRGPGSLRQRRRGDSGRARDLMGIAILAGAALYAIATERASTWFLAASGLGILAQVFGSYLRAAAQARANADPSIEVDEDAEDGEPLGCPLCGHGTLIVIDDPARLLSGLNQFSSVSATVCPKCGALSGQVEEPKDIPIGAEHGTSLRRSPSSEDQEALEEPAEHDG